MEATTTRPATGEADRLRRRLAEIESCVRAFAGLGGTLDLDELLRRAMDSARDVMNAEASSIMLRDEATGDLVFRATGGDERDAGARAALRTIRIPRGRGIAGWVAERAEPALVPDAQADPRLFKEADIGTGFVTRNLIAVPLLSGDRLIGVAEVLNKREGTFDEEDLRSFEAYAALVASAVEAARLHKRLMTDEVNRRELEMARQIQENLQGPAEASVPGARFAARSIPAREVGGDLHDLLLLPGGFLGALVGDVSGKGVPAALLMANALSRFRTRATRDPSATLAEMNAALVASTARGLFVTAAYHVYDPEDGVLVSAAAGHAPGWVWRAARGDVEPLPRAEAPPLGILDGIAFPARRTRLWPGDVLLVATDGLAEARAPDGEEFGDARLVEILGRAAARGAAPAEVVEEVLAAVSTFAGGEDARDDATAIVLRAEAVPVRSLEPYRLAFRACAEALADVRAAAEAYCRRAGLDARTAGNIVLALDEACSNVIRHGYKGSGAGAMDLTFEFSGGDLVFAIEDRAPPFSPPAPPRMPGEEAVSGRGLSIIHAVMDDVRFEPRGEGTRTILRKRVRA